MLRPSYSGIRYSTQTDGKINHNRVLDALRRPLRLARKYSRRPLD